MRYLRSILSGPVSALAIVILSAPFWCLRIQDEVVVLAIGWTIAWAIVEVASLIRKQPTTPRLLTHLRWGPAAVLLIFVVVVVSYYNIQIYQSRQAAKNYIYYDPESDLTTLDLHVSYRGWCGNGAFSDSYGSLIETALEGFENNSPEVRLRALRLANSLSYGAYDDRYGRLLERALADSDPAVTCLADHYYDQYYGYSR